VELSGATLRTWVAKTAHFRSGDLGVVPGSRVLVDLPLHWTAAVCWLALDAVGAELLQPDDGGPVDVAVVGPEHLDRPPDADEVVAVSLRPMGAPFADPLPALVHDFSVEVRNQPDDYPFPAGPDTADGRAGERLAQHWQLERSDRLLVLGDEAHRPSPVRDLLAALAADASVVWVRNPAVPVDVERVVAEQVTAVVDVVAAVPGAGGPGTTTTTWPGGIRVLAGPSVS